MRLSVDVTVPTLDIRGLSVSFRDPRLRATTRVLSDVSFSVMAGEAVGIVGESGSGKSLTSLAVMGLLPSNANVDAGEVLLEGEDLLRKSPRAMRRVRGQGVSMVLQDPMSSLDPSFTIGDQLAEAFRINRSLRGDACREASISLLEAVRIPSPAERLRQYPHELSGGMRQRVCSAIALAGEPRVLIADEPTTALDMTTQAQYLALLRELQTSIGFALVLISHDLSVVRHMCSQLVVMYAGQVVERGSLADILHMPTHPYTNALFHAMPTLGRGTRLTTIEGQAPDPSEYSSGCRFAPRCRYAHDVCSESSPELSDRGGARVARCFGTQRDGWIADFVDEKTEMVS